MSKKNQRDTTRQKMGNSLIEKSNQTIKKKELVKRLVALTVCGLLILGIAAVPLVSMAF